MKVSLSFEKLLSWAALATLTLSSVACYATAKPMTVTYLSYPSNAALFRANTNQQIGVAPQTVTYMVSPEQQQQGFIMLPEVTARWVSGATASSGEIKAPVSATSGYAQEFTVMRPAGAPGAEIDAEYAFQHARNKIEAERNDIMVGRVTE